MKVKLICPFVSRLNFEQRLSSPPLSLASLSGALKKNNFEVSQDDLSVKIIKDGIDEVVLLGILNSSNTEIIFGYLTGKRRSLLLDRLTANLLKLTDYKDYDLIGFTVFEKFAFLVALLLAKRIKDTTGARVILGGPFFNYLNKDVLLTFKFIDYVQVGEGEESFLRLVRGLARKDSIIENIDGLLLRKNDKIIFNGPKVSNIDSAPVPYFEKKTMHYYRNQLNFASGPVVLPYEVSKGCIDRCLFCTYYSPLRQKTISKVAGELKYLSERYKTGTFIFMDNAINQSRAYLERLCDAFIRRKMQIRWMALAKPRALDRGLLKKMHRAGCRLLIYGVESGSQSVLDRMEKKLKLTEIERVLKDTFEAGILNHIFLIAGYPYETEDEFHGTLRFLDRNNDYIDMAYCSPFLLFNSSLLHLFPKRYGIKIIPSGDRDLSSFVRVFNDIRFDEIGGLTWRKKRQQQLLRAETINRRFSQEKCLI